MAARKWTEAQKQAQSKAIQLWRPWCVSKGAKTDSGKKISSMNAYNGGHRPLMRELARALKEQDTFIRELDCQ
jgi:hypothetical protein